MGFYQFCLVMQQCVQLWHERLMMLHFFIFFDPFYPHRKCSLFSSPFEHFSLIVGMLAQQKLQVSAPVSGSIWFYTISELPLKCPLVSFMCKVPTDIHCFSVNNSTLLYFMLLFGQENKLCNNNLFCHVFFEYMCIHLLIHS